MGRLKEVFGLMVLRDLIERIVVFRHWRELNIEVE